jgi:hypothetical protein
MYSRVDRFKKFVIYSLDVACSDSEYIFSLLVDFRGCHYCKEKHETQQQQKQEEKRHGFYERVKNLTAIKLNQE